MTFFRDNIEAMTPYVPGEQPAAGEQVIKLNTNENPYPPSPAAMAAMRELDGDLLRRYPDAMATRFREVAAGVLGVPAAWILPGNGSDDLVTMIARACLAPGRPVVYPVPTFTFYETQALIEAAECVEAPFDEEYNLPVDALAEADGAVTLVANPNSPSGTAAPAGRLDELAARLTGLLVIDEAYVDFADGHALDLVGKRENVIVLRTLSKGYSLAGLRLGFGVAQPATLEGLLKTKAIYNVGAIPAAVGAAALADQDHKNANAEKIKASRADLTTRLRALGFRVLPSQSNFLLARPPDGDGGRVYLALKQRGILVRYYRTPRLRDQVRITIGTDEDNAALLHALGELL